MRLSLTVALTVLLLCALTGCPRGAQNAAPAGPRSSQPVASAAASTNSSTAIPADEPLCTYAGLHLGMSSVELAQVYNAPEGQGDGFTRVLTKYGDVAQHYIDFDAKPGEPARRLIAAFYRDKLYWIVDRRDKLTAAQAGAWREACIKDYGQPSKETVAGAQWSWYGKEGLQLVLTQDNSSEELMSANVVLVHEPTQNAAREYLDAWAKAHPDYQYPQP